MLTVEEKKDRNRIAAMKWYDKNKRNPKPVKEYPQADDITIAFLAGIIDGEGSVAIRQQKNGSVDFNLIIVNTHLPVLEKISYFYGGKIYNRTKIEGRQQTYSLYLSGLEAKRAVEAFLPYSMIKEPQYLAFLDAYTLYGVKGDGTGRKGIKLTPEQIEERRQVVELLKSLKRPVTSEEL